MMAKTDRHGRWYPSRPIEHLIYWPVMAAIAVFLLFLGFWLKETIHPYSEAFASWLHNLMGETGLTILLWSIAIIAVCAFIYAFRERRPPNPEP